MNKLDNEQIETVVKWLNSWDQLKDTAIPLRFKEEFATWNRVLENEQTAEGHKILRTMCGLEILP